MNTDFLIPIYFHFELIKFIIYINKARIIKNNVKKKFLNFKNGCQKKINITTI